MLCKLCANSHRLALWELGITSGNPGLYAQEYQGFLLLE